MRLDFGQNPGRFRSTIANPKPTNMHPKPIRPEPADLKLHSGQLQVKIFTTQCCRVEFGLGTNPTRPDPWTALAVSIILKTGMVKAPELGMIFGIYLFFSIFWIGLGFNSQLNWAVWFLLKQCSWAQTQVVARDQVPFWFDSLGLKCVLVNPNMKTRVNSPSYLFIWNSPSYESYLNATQMRNSTN